MKLVLDNTVRITGNPAKILKLKELGYTEVPSKKPKKDPKKDPEKEPEELGKE